MSDDNIHQVLRRSESQTAIVEVLIEDVKTSLLLGFLLSTEVE